MDLPADWSTDVVQTNGVDLRYYRTGAGQPLVMAHGFYENGRCWEPLASALAEDYEVVTFDARGHGGSEAPETGYGIDDRVADLVGLAEALDLDDPILLGHSMGGSTVAWTAARHPSLPEAVVLEEPAGMYGDPEYGPEERVEIVHDRLEEWSNAPIDEIAGELDEDDPKLARRIAIAHTECSPRIAEIAREGYPHLPDAFADIECPTLVLKADADPERRVEDLEAADELVNGRLVHVPGAGHTVFRDRFEAAVKELRTFLRRR
ncbi:MAG: alpha/beta hydrolase [Halobacteriales archaeon]